MLRSLREYTVVEETANYITIAKVDGKSTTVIELLGVAEEVYKESGAIFCCTVLKQAVFRKDNRDRFEKLR